MELSLSIKSLVDSFLIPLKNFTCLQNNGDIRLQLSVKKLCNHYLVVEM